MKNGFRTQPSPDETPTYLRWTRFKWSQWRMKLHKGEKHESNNKQNTVLHIL